MSITIEDLNEEKQQCETNLKGAKERARLATLDTEYWQAQFEATMTMRSRKMEELEAEIEV